MTCVSLDTSASRLASGGADGALCVTEVAAGRGAGPATSPIVPPCPSVAIVDAAWRSAADVATLAAGGSVCVWDVRTSSSTPSARAPPPPSPTDAGTRLAVTPALPHALAVGTRGGRVDLLDVRCLGRGATASAALLPGPRPEGGVTALTFDTLPSMGVGGPPVLFTTAGGALASAAVGGRVGGREAPAPATLLYREPCGAAVALALDGGGADTVVATDHECLVYLRRGG